VRSQTPSALGSLLAPETGEAYIVLLTIQPGGGGEPFHFSSDSVDTVVGGAPATPLVDLSPPANNWDLATGGAGNWTDNLDNSFDLATSADDPQSYILNDLAANLLTPGSSYDVYFTISSLSVQTTFSLEVLLGTGGSNREIVPIPSNGQYMATLTFQTDTMFFQAIQSTGDVSCTITLDYIYAAGTDPDPPPTGGITYAAFPFDITLPKNLDNQISTASLSVTNVDRRLITAIRGQTEAMTVDIEVVLGSPPYDKMVKYVDFTWRNLTYDAMTVSGTLTLEDFLSEQVGHIMTAANYRSIFYA
jgi:hypothetical protein